jgi:predicted P-loop ATPase
VFAGTTNSTEWGDDETGLRRFWPVRCGDINLSLLEEAREQLFAEAVASCREGASWWQMPSQTAEIQAERQFHHEWSSVILDWCDRQPTEGGVMVKDILLGPLAFTIDRLMDKRAQMAVAKILTVAGWKRIPTRISSKRTTKVWYKVDN